MYNTIRDAKEEARNAVEVEVYRWYNGKRHIVHTDSIVSIDEMLEDFDDDTPCDCYLMDENEYEHAILANSSIRADFADWYGDPNAKILIVIL